MFHKNAEAKKLDLGLYVSYFEKLVRNLDGEEEDEPIAERKF
jgi:hypothetical protein